MVKFNRSNLIIIITIFMVSLLIKKDMQGQTEIEMKIDSIFNGFQQERFLYSGMYEESGWILELPSGETITKALLLRQADTIAKFGRDAVPGLYKWVMSDELYIRYIAVQALVKITGIQQPIPIFEKKDPGESRQKAIKIWNEWYEEQEN